MDKNLFNEIENQEILYRQYELYVTMADKISERRATANNFFILLTSALFAVLFAVENEKLLIFLAILGIGISVVWWLQIFNYKKLNAEKFKIIGEIENRLPVNLYSYEWKKLGEGENKWKYWPISHVELLIPIILIIFYLGFMVYAFFIKQNLTN